MRARRADRVLELSRAFDEEDFDAFDRKRVPKVRIPSAPGRGVGAAMQAHFFDLHQNGAPTAFILQAKAAVTVGQLPPGRGSTGLSSVLAVIAVAN